MKKKITLFILTFGIVIASHAQLQNFTVGQTSPDFTIVDVNGVTHTLYQYTDAGKYVLLDLSVLACHACWDGPPLILNDFYHKYGCNAYNVVVLGILLSGDDDDVEQFDFMSDLPDDHYPEAGGTGGGYNVANLYNPASTPTFTLIGHDRKFISIDIWPLEDVSTFEAIFPSGALTPHSCSTTMTEEFVSINNFSIFPNPANSEINITATKNLINSNYTITDKLGQVVVSGIITNENFKINLEKFSSGMYFFNVNGYIRQTFKFLKY